MIEKQALCGKVLPASAECVPLKIDGQFTDGKNAEIGHCGKMLRSNGEEKLIIFTVIESLFNGTSGVARKALRC